MIDEKRLDEMADILRDICRYPRTMGDPAALIDGDELIRLARLGLWAENHAIPALKTISAAKGFTRLADCCVDKACHLNSETGTCSFQTGVNYGNCDRAGEADKALAALKAMGVEV